MTEANIFNCVGWIVPGTFGSMSSYDDPWETVSAINEAWTTQTTDQLDQLLHPDVIIVGPELAARGVGRQACIAGYAEFAERASDVELAVADRHVHVTGDTAIAAYRFRLSYRVDDDPVEEAGTDLWVLVRDRDRWWAAWRLLTSSEVP